MPSPQRRGFGHYWPMCWLCNAKTTLSSSTVLGGEAVADDGQGSHCWSSRRGFLLASAASGQARLPCQRGWVCCPAQPTRKWMWGAHRRCAHWCLRVNWKAAGTQYHQMLQEARQQNALAPEGHPQLRRLRAIAKRLIPHTTLERPCQPLAVGGQPDRQQTNQRFLHAGAKSRSTPAS